MKTRILLLLSCLLLTVAQIQADRLPYVIDLPEGDTQGAPLVIMLHPSASSGLAMQILTDFGTFLPDSVVVYPNSADIQWEHNATSEANTADDPLYLQELVTEMADTYGIDTEHVSLVGYGSGGLLAFRMMCESPELFENVVIVGPLMWEYHATNCSTPTEEVSPPNLLMVHGSEDTTYWGEGRLWESITQEWFILGVESTLGFWADRFTCDTEQVTQLGTNAITLPCADDAELAFYHVMGGGHNWARIGDYQLNQFGIDTSEIVSGFINHEADWATEQPTPFEDDARTYWLYVPSSYDPATPTPLIVALHGRYSNGISMAATTQFNPLAEQEGFLVVYPDGLSTWADYRAQPGDMSWNYAGATDLYFDPGYDDVGFLANLIDDLALDLNIDLNRVYVAGFSNGAYMTHHLACVDAERYAAFAAVAGSAYIGMDDLCQQDTPVSMLMIHGSGDNNILWNGIQEVVDGEPIYTSFPIPSLLGFWLEHNYCNPETYDSVDIPNQDDITRVLKMSFTTCLNGADVGIYAIQNGGHNWSGSHVDLPFEIIGNINYDINASEVIWEFFETHSR